LIDAFGVAKDNRPWTIFLWAIGAGVSEDVLSFVWHNTRNVSARFVEDEVHREL